MKFVLKSAIAEAMLFTGEPEVAAEIETWSNGAIHFQRKLDEISREYVSELMILSNNGQPHLVASVGEWIIKDTTGQFYTCLPRIFSAIYDPLDEEATKELGKTRGKSIVQSSQVA